MEILGDSSHNIAEEGKKLLGNLGDKIRPLGSEI